MRGQIYNKIMYQGKRKIMRLDEYNERRKEIIATKCGAVWNAFTELEGLINKTATTCPTISKVRRRWCRWHPSAVCGLCEIKV